MRLAIVTGTLNYPQAKTRLKDWFLRATTPYPLYIVGQLGFLPGWTTRCTVPIEGDIHMYGSPEILGVVPAFAIGVQKALEDGADIIACIHDDVEIHQAGWDETILSFFEEHPRCGLLGFGGGRGLGDPNLYSKPYDPMQLARRDFVSNMVDAEAHGRRVTAPTRVAALDGFSQIGRRAFWMGLPFMLGDDARGWTIPPGNLFQTMADANLRHHFYDGCLGCYAKRLGWEVWMLPIRVRHLGGQTAVGDPRYAEWALQHGRFDVADDGYTQTITGDQAFWYFAHQWGYHEFRDCLPILIEEVESHATRNPV